MRIDRIRYNIIDKGQKTRTKSYLLYIAVSASFMSFLPSTLLSPSPVEEAFSGIQWDPLEKLQLAANEKALLRAAEDNVISYTLARQDEAREYTHILLKVLDEVVVAGNKNSKVARLALEESLPDDEALQLLYVDYSGVVAHYAITKLCEVVLCLKESSKNSKVTLLSTFYQPNGTLIENWRPLLRILLNGGSDAFAQRGAAFCLASVLLEGDKLEKESVLESFVSWMTARLQSSTMRALSVVTPSLTVLLVSRDAREIFDKAGGIGYLARHLRVRKARSDTKQIGAGASVQQMYELCYCLWLLSFDCGDSQDIRNHFHRDGAVPALVDLVAAARREKIVRLALSTLRNLAVCKADVHAGSSTKRAMTGSMFLTEMIGCGLLKWIDLMKERQWKDADLNEDLASLHSLLHAAFRKLTRWDVYKSEVESSYLKWGIVHNEKFFKENARRMEGIDGNFKIVKTLIKLASSSDEEIAAIACFDIGEFVRHYPNGKHIAGRLGARDVVMGLIEHEDTEVQRQALLCISKMLVQNWQVLHAIS